MNIQKAALTASSDALDAELNAADATIDAADAAGTALDEAVEYADIETLAAIVDAMGSFEITRTDKTAQNRADRASDTANDAGRHAGELHNAINNAFDEGDPDIIHIKRAAAAWSSAAEKYIEAADKHATISDNLSNKFKRAAAAYAALDSSADPFIWPPRVVDKFAESAAAWKSTYDAYTEAATKHTKAAAAWSALDRWL